MSSITTCACALWSPTCSAPTPAALAAASKLPGAMTKPTFTGCVTPAWLRGVDVDPDPDRGRAPAAPPGLTDPEAPPAAVSAGVVKAPPPGTEAALFGAAKPSPPLLCNGVPLELSGTVVPHPAARAAATSATSIRHRTALTSRAVIACTALIR